MEKVSAQIDPRIPVLVLAEALASRGLVIRHNPETMQLFITETDETRALRERREAELNEFGRLLEAKELESYIDCNGKRCYRPRGEGERIRHENRVKRNQEAEHHAEMIREEVGT
jgi:hypothetical protein